MPFISEESAYQIVKPYLGDLLGIVREAWSDWLRNPVAAQMQHPRTRAEIVWNQMVSHAKRRFDGDPRVKVQPVKFWQGILIDGKVFIRMKKAEKSLLSRNYPTPSAFAFNDQENDLFDGVSRLEVVYVLSEDEADLERVVLVQRHQKKITWALSLVSDDDQSSQEVLPFAPIAPLSGDVAQRVIKRKKGQAEKDGTQDKSAMGGEV
ncbi:hypothetical protein ACQUFY_20990 [Robbsia andropogonis]|uniref:hypothetical protein n=1 Tax=Robbsia andropogonis TaxID=28092 RepID=UPI003D20B520